MKDRREKMGGRDSGDGAGRSLLDCDVGAAASGPRVRQEHGFRDEALANQPSASFRRKQESLKSFVRLFWVKVL